jgi:hypothetical protein
VQISSEEVETENETRAKEELSSIDVVVVTGSSASACCSRRRCCNSRGSNSLTRACLEKRP